MITPLTLQSASDVASHYDELDNTYRELWGEHVHHGYWETGYETNQEAVENLVLRVATELGVQVGHQVVDIGCGYGATSRFLQDRFGAVATGFTVSRAQFEYANTHHPGASQLFLRNWMENGLAGSTFDGAIAVESLAHMEDKPLFFAEAFRVLKPGGRLVICAWLSCPQPKAWEVRYLLEPIAREGRLPSMGSALEYVAMMEKCGFQSIRVEDISVRVKRTWTKVLEHFLSSLCHNSHARKIVLNPKKKNRIFAATIFRIWLAFQTGSMRYAILSGSKP